MPFNPITVSGRGTYRAVADSLSQDETVGLFVPKLGDRIWIPAADFTVTLGSITEDDAQRVPVLSYPAGTSIAAAMYFLPSHWERYNAYLYWTNLTAGTGDVDWFFGDRSAFGDGDTLSTATGAIVTATAPAENVVEVTTLQTDRAPATGYATKPSRFVVRRNSGDTLAGAAGFLGLLLERQTTAADPDPALLT